MRYVLLIVIALASNACTRLFFFPSSGRFSDPGAAGVRFEEHVLNDGKGPPLIVWHLPAEGKSKGTIFFLHGNAENISTHYLSVVWLPAEGYTVVLFDYRGYGGSQGSPGVAGIHADAIRAFEFSRDELKVFGSKPILYGQSLGAAVALWLAAQPRFAGVFSFVIAESPFASYPLIFRDKMRSFLVTYPWAWPLSLFVSDVYSPVNLMRSITAELLLVHGTDDEIIPLEHSRILCGELGERCKLWEIPARGHLQLFTTIENRARLLDWLRSTLETQPIALLPRDRL